MFRKFTLLLVVVVLFTLTACQPVSMEAAQADYCADLEAYALAVQDVKNLPEDATVEDLDAAMEVVDAALRELENSAWTLADSQTAELQPAYSEMRLAVDDIEKGTPVVEARAIISDAVGTYMATYEEIVSVSCVGM